RGVPGAVVDGKRGLLGMFVDIFKCEESLFECEDCLNAWRRHVNESLFEFLIGRL
ncbi:hypothetical protein U1Q18_051969, partial [Sarracenia purpurea var. burkii]